MKILITGGAGFIGSHLIDELLNRDYEVYSFDNHLPGFGNKKTKANSISGDIRKFEDVDFAFKKIDVVVHLAALSHVTTCRTNPKLCYDVNVGGTVNILEAARVNSTGRVIVAASDHIYGRNPEMLPVHEYCELFALGEPDPYGHSKTMQVYLSGLYHNAYKVPVVLTASGNVFSERQSPPNVIPNFVKAALNNEDLIIHGDGKQTRDIYHIDNLVDGYIRCIENPNAVGNLFNFGGETELSVNQIAWKVLELIPESTSNVKYVENNEANAMDRMILDISKAKKVLGYKVIVSFEEGLKRTIERYRGLK